MSLIEKGSKPSSKRVRRCDDDGGSDSINKLHDDLIVHILSFLPLKESAATSLVAPRWSQLWRYTPNLVFHNDSELDPEINIPITMPPGETCSFTRGSLKTIAWVNSVIDSHKALSLKQFALEFCLHDVQPLPKWLQFALSRSVEILKLDFEDTSCYDLDIDTDVFTGIQSSDFKFVKELTLRNFTVSGETIELLVHNSPLLERLVLDVYLKSNLVIVGGTFKHFELLNRGTYDVSIKVSAPNLTRLRCCFDTSRLFLEDVPNLVDASFELMDGDTLDCLANSTSSLEILTILLHNPMAFSTPQMPKLRKLFLDYFSANKEFRVPVTDLLQASPCLQEFRLKVTDNGWHYEDFTDGESIFEEPKLGKFPHPHLKVFEFSGFYFVAADHMELLRYIVDNCVALEEIIISPLLEARYSKLPCESSTEHPESNTYKILPSSYGTYGNAVGSDERVVGSDEGENELRIKEVTGGVVAGKVPPHVNLLIGHFVSRLYIC